MTKKKPPLRIVPNRQDANRAEKLIVDASHREALRFIEGFGPIKGRCESPIEELLMAALYEASKLTEVSMHFMGGTKVPDEPYFYETAFIYQQVPIGSYRVDILIHDGTLHQDEAKARLMVIECDGHDFHEKTKEQARRDKQRDRFLVSRGIKVLRYTGSEIWANPEDCAEEIIDELAYFDEYRAKRK